MITKKQIIEAANRFGFEDAGFTSVEPFESQRQYLAAHQEEYGWAEAVGLELLKGTDPKNIMPEGKTIIVLMEVYFREAYPPKMASHFGRCYLDDDRVIKDGLTQRIKGFRGVLRDNGIDSKVPFNLPHRVAAARSGMGTFGKNCLFYSKRVARQSSWVLPIAVVVNHEFEPDVPSIGIGCPDWCRNACIAACPTRALKGDGRIDPRKCISFLTYFGQGVTPYELREPMGLYVYGCDRCQNVCPRNAAWLANDLPVNQKVAAKAKDFELEKLLHMDKPYFETRIWPHMFYMSYNDVWRWKMNVARVMGNTLDEKYVDDLIKAFEENQDERVSGMIAWALGKIGGIKAKNALGLFKAKSQGVVLEEISKALERDNT
jgi:epoxyqueuosine reductase